MEIRHDEDLVNAFALAQGNTLAIRLEDRYVKTRPLAILANAACMQVPATARPSTLSLLPFRRKRPQVYHRGRAKEKESVNAADLRQ